MYQVEQSPVFPYLCNNAIWSKLLTFMCIDKNERKYGRKTCISGNTVERRVSRSKQNICDVTHVVTSFYVLRPRGIIAMIAASTWADLCGQ